MASKKPRPTSNAVEILHRRYVTDRPDQEAALEEARLNAAIAQEIYDLRTKAGLTQKQLADLVGTTHSVISRLEDADYAGHSIKMLQRISAALHYRLQVRFVPVGARRKVPA
ncbi:MAG: helix-turn-helix transcriptional regulator [Thermoanaerobaculia bacterium]